MPRLVFGELKYLSIMSSQMERRIACCRLSVDVGAAYQI
jgi:hypothetical protein